MRKIAFLLLSLLLLPSLLLLGTGQAQTTNTRVALPQVFVMIDISPGNQDAYYRCPETWGGEQNNDTKACEKIPVNMTFNGSVYGPWSGFQMQTHLMGEPYFNNPIIPWAKGTTGLFGRVYVTGAEADGELRTQVNLETGVDKPTWHLGSFKKGVDTVIPFDGLYDDFGANGPAVPDAMNFMVNARVFLRVEIFGYYTAQAGPTPTPTATPIPPTPTATPIPPTPTPSTPDCHVTTYPDGVKIEVCTRRLA